MNIAFNPHTFIKRLVAAGLAESVAEVLAEEQGRLIDERLATKEDLAKLEQATKADIQRLELASIERLKKLELELRTDTENQTAALRADIERQTAALRADIDKQNSTLNAEMNLLKFQIKADMAETKADLMKWSIGVSMGQVAVIVALLKLIPGTH